MNADGSRCNGGSIGDDNLGLAINTFGIDEEGA